MTDDTSNQREDNLHARILRLTQLYKALSEINQAIVRMEDETALFPLVCRVAVQFGGARMGWIGTLDPDTDRLVPVESYGSGTEYVNNIVITTTERTP